MSRSLVRSLDALVGQLDVVLDELDSAPLVAHRTPSHAEALHFAVRWFYSMRSLHDGVPALRSRWRRKSGKHSRVCSSCRTMLQQQRVSWPCPSLIEIDRHLDTISRLERKAARREEASTFNPPCGATLRTRDLIS